MADLSDFVQHDSFVPELNFDGIDFGAPPGEQYMMPDFFDPSIILPTNTAGSSSTATENCAKYVDSGQSDIGAEQAGTPASDTSPPQSLHAMATLSLNTENACVNVNQAIGQEPFAGHIYSIPQMPVQRQQQQIYNPQLDYLRHDSSSPSAASNVTTPASVTTATETVRPPKRRPHRKSRTGCRTCKRRRVKCDEIHPRCGNCSHLGLTCSFQTVASMLVNDTAIARTGMGVGGSLRSAHMHVMRGINPGAVEPGDDAELASMASSAISGHSLMLGLGTSTVAFNLEDLRLMHVYATTVNVTIIKMSENQADIWQRRVPQLAFQHAALMHALLAFCGSYVVRQEYADVSLKAVIGERTAMHRSEAVRILRNALHSPLSAEMADPALLTGYILMLDSMANAPTITGAKKDNMPTTHTSMQFLTATPWVHLLRGICCILKSVKPILQPGSIIQSILIDEFYDLPLPRSKLDYNAFAKDLQPYSIKKNFVVSAKQHVLSNYTSTRLGAKTTAKEDEWLYDDEDDLADIYPVTSTSPYVIPCFMLSKFKSVAVAGRYRVMSLLCISLGLLDDRFYAKFHSTDAVAHRLIAEQYRALKRFAKCNCNDVWWLENLADGLDIEIPSGTGS
ncbi:hypothetical protein LIPSTDRAFT_75958 [Lipomyces starkeyi NRRL Y-11557]|uniref:Zn(2)-C6 fungal-type domain-containing protein n=1 Tax=Lipomyces starkeyi NRRL Y-11557 TaxID=675824 RepID=A0A1E3PV89_LIPST|nr:hypothetical protein LIPSTDRAFT_75958 [Lipomyces starkeyi NRRL Y-11557]